MLVVRTADSFVGRDPADRLAGVVLGAALFRLGRDEEARVGFGPRSVGHEIWEFGSEFMYMDLACRAMLMRRLGRHDESRALFQELALRSSAWAPRRGDRDDRPDGRRG